jgi:hypothetical protein
MHWACPNLIFGIFFLVSGVGIAFAPDKGGGEKCGEDNDGQQSVALGLPLSLNHETELTPKRIHNDLL